jgi:GntP family gluconate:H+ symporter
VTGVETLLAFFICIALITIATAYYKFPPFPVLFGAAILFGSLSGLNPGIVTGAATAGAGRIFAILGVAVWGGSIIAATLSSGGGIGRILSDMSRISSKTAVQAGFSGWLLAVPFMCAITPFLVIAPIIRGIAADPKAAGRLFSLVAAGSVLSFVLIAPAPVMATLMQTFSGDPGLNRITLPLSLILLIGIIAVLSRGIRMKELIPREDIAGRGAAWAPLVVPILLIVIGFLVPGIGLVGSLPVALISGAAVAVWLTKPTLRKETVRSGTKHAGVIIFDLCGAGAFGGVIAASTFPTDAAGLLGAAVPLAIIPFILAALIQTAQGSRVVTAVITADIIAATAIPDLIPATPLILMIAAGTMVISYASDPFFWLLNRSAGQTVTETGMTFTLPLAVAGFAVFGVALLLI